MLCIPSVVHSKCYAFKKNCAFKLYAFKMFAGKTFCIQNVCDEILAFKLLHYKNLRWDYTDPRKLSLDCKKSVAIWNTVLTRFSALRFSALTQFSAPFLGYQFFYVVKTRFSAPSI